jgi:hypothetical protein
MAKVGNNIVTARLSGKLGDLIVFRTRGNSTYVTSAHRKSEKEPTAGQAAHQRQFQEAIIYGKSVITVPERKEAYKAAAVENQSAFNVAVADFMHAPHIDEVDISAYRGQPGDVIRIRAVDDFAVVQASVSIYNADSSLVEEGSAVLQPNGLDWLYTSTTSNTSLEGDKIVIRVNDTPGHSDVSERIL